MALVLTGALMSAAAVVAAVEPQELRLGSDEWPPFTSSDARQRAAVELVHTALERGDVRAATSISQWKLVEAGIRRGELDGSAAMWRSEKREETLLFSRPYLENRLVLIGRSGSDVSAARMNELAGKRVALVGRYAYGEEIEKAVGVLFVSARSDQDSLEKLLGEEVDYMLVDELVARHLLTFQPDEVAANLEIGDRPLARRMLHFALRRDVPNAAEIIAAFDAEIRRMLGDGTYAEILQVGWIRVDIDGDGLYELVPLGEHVGETPPSSIYDVFGEMPEEKEPEKQRVVIQGNIYEGWDAIPEQFRQPSSHDGGTTYKQGTTLVTLKF